MKKKVVYSPGGLNHILGNVTDLIVFQSESFDSLEFHTGVQPNGIPHFGTMTTLMCTFALAKLFRDKYDKPVSVIFDSLSNSPAKTEIHSGEVYFTSLKDSYLNGVSESERNLTYYKEFLSQISNKSQVPYKIRDYESYISEPRTRQSLLKLLDNREVLSLNLNPKDHRLRIRPKCPHCNLSQKSASDTRYERNLTGYVIYSRCPIHGSFSVDLNERNSDFVDINSQLRDLLKGVYLNSERKETRTLGFMVDGGDWSGNWEKLIHSESLSLLGLSCDTPRYFCPVITDWSGAKLSKSLYVDGDAYSYLSKAFLNYREFIHHFGNRGIELLWTEVYSWVVEPKKFFRNYSIEYIQELVNEN
jgi:hypothetical protein